MCARTDLWEPWAGNRPGPPGHYRHTRRTASFATADPASVERLIGRYRRDPRTASLRPHRPRVGGAADWPLQARPTADLPSPPPTATSPAAIASTGAIEGAGRAIR